MGTSIPPPGPRSSIAGRVVLLFVLYCFVVLMLRSAEGAALSLFLGHLGVARLPYTFLAISLVDLPLALVYMRVARSVPHRLLLAGLAMLLVILLAAVWMLAGRWEGTGLFCGYMVVTILNTFVVIQWGVLLLDYFTVEESRRAFPLVYAGAHLGGFIAGLALRGLAVPLGTLNLLVIVPSVSAAVVVVLIGVAGRLREGREVRQGESIRSGDRSPMKGLRHLSLLWKSPLLGAIAASTAVMVLLRLALRYCYGAGFEQAFPDADDLTRFIGTYTMIASAAGIVLQILATPTLLRRLGVGTMNVGYSLLMGLSFLGSTFVPGLWSSAAGRFTDQDLKSAIKTPLSAIFYEPLGEKNRADGRAMILGIVSPVSALVSSLMLVTVAAMQLDAWKVAAVGSALSLVFVVLSWYQGRAYRKELGAYLVKWAKTHGNDDDVSHDKALEAALKSGDRRIEDMAREHRRR